MQSLTGFARKYAIMEELDGGFGAGSTPEAFVRLDSWEGRIQASLHVKGLKQGPYTYKLYLIFAKNEKLVPLLAGALSTNYSGMQNGFEIDADTLKTNGVKPETVRYAAITAESQDNKSVPLFSSFEKSYRWDESIRQLLLRKPIVEESKKEEPKLKNYYTENHPEVKAVSLPVQAEEKSNPQASQQVKAASFMTGTHQEDYKNPSNQEPNQGNKNPSAQEPSYGNKNPLSSTYDSGNLLPKGNKTEPEATPVSANTGYSAQKSAPQDNHFNRCDINKLEGLLQNNFEVHIPFKRSSRGYSWYRVSDLAKLSNIMYMSGVNVPVFANPKILVGLFKFKHVLAGLYRGENGAHYYVIGVPAKDESDNKPFENACRWVPISDTSIRDMGGYWLVYVSLKSGEIVV